MIDGFIRTAACTPEIRVADPAFNCVQVKEMIREAAEEGVRIAVFPELVLSGYTCADLFHQTALVRKNKEALDEAAEFTRDYDMVVILGTLFSTDHKLYNCAAVLYGGEILAMIPKKNLPNYSEFYEMRWFTPGKESVLWIPYTSSVTGASYEIPFGTNILLEAADFPGLSLACELCEDVWVPDPPSTKHALAGASIIANCSASDEMVGKDSYRRELIRQTSARLVSAYIYANAGEGESSTDLVFGGQNLIAENGSLISESDRFTTGICCADIDLERITQERARLTTYPQVDEAVRDSYEIIPFLLGNDTAVQSWIQRYVDPRPFVPGNRDERMLRCNEIFMIQAMGLKKRLKHIHGETVVLGISGGLDSTLALLVCAKAFDMLGIDRKNIISVTMPAFGTTNRTYQNAVKLTESLGATLREINIKASVLQHFADIGHDPEDHSVTYENAQARERTQILMDIANQMNGIVIGTGDLSELALGWATYNGDHMSMYAVNVGVPKTLVRYLVRFVADTTEDQALRDCLLDVCDTPVSPELLPPTGEGTISQKTEDLVGPYELHDFFLYQILRYGFSPKKVYALACRAFSEENQRTAGVESPMLFNTEEILKWLKIFYRRFFAQQFKRSCLPDGPKVGSVAVSPRGDLRMPSDASAALWMEELDLIGKESV